MTAGVGKAMRLKRVIDTKGVSVICALDHGMTSPTFLEPLSDIAARTAEEMGRQRESPEQQKRVGEVQRKVRCSQGQLALRGEAQLNEQRAQYGFNQRECDGRQRCRACEVATHCSGECPGEKADG